MAKGHARSRIETPVSVATTFMGRPYATLGWAGNRKTLVQHHYFQLFLAVIHHDRMVEINAGEL